MGKALLHTPTVGVILNRRFTNLRETVRQCSVHEVVVSFFPEICIFEMNSNYSWSGLIVETLMFKTII